jgi:ion channel
VSALLVGVGVVLIVVGLADVFLTVLHYENPGFLAVRTYRYGWEIARRITAPLPRRLRGLMRSMTAPAMVVLNLTGWLGFQIVGFALVYEPAIAHGHFTTARNGTSFGTALYFSAASLTSLSFSDVEPRTLAYHGVAALETLVGLALLTLAISYLLNLYRILQDQGALSTGLFHHARNGNEPLTLLEPHFPRGRPAELGTLVRTLHDNITTEHEGLRRYPIVWYFHTRRPYRSLPYMFWFTGAAAAALRWGVPEGHPTSEEPWLPGLIRGFDDVVDRVASRFLPEPLPDPPEPVALDVFACAVRTSGDLASATRSGGGEGADEGAAGDDGLTRFLAVERAMCELASTSPERDVERRYRRYCAWSIFVGRGRIFVEAASRDLGLDPATLYEAPERLRF